MNSKSFFSPSQNRKKLSVNFFRWIESADEKFLCSAASFKKQFLLNRSDIRLDFAELIIEARGRINKYEKYKKFIPATVQINSISPLHTQIESNSEPTMESLARALIGFVLIYQLLPMAGCKVIRQRDEHEKEISASEVNYERSNLFSPLLDDASMEKFNETSIKYYTNATLESSSGSGVNSLTHMWVTDFFSLIYFFIFFLLLVE